MKKPDYSNLRSKTVFDFTNDVSVLESIDIYFDKAEYIKLFKGEAVSKALHLLQLADATNNKALRSAVEAEFSKELEAYFNE